MSTESSSPPRWKYDVFLSFRGEDTRKTFTDHLYTALDHYGIITFRDDPALQKGEAISPALFDAIKESRFALIVLSQNYASSTWCLEELVKILECMKARGTVLPIFYDVDPSDVRKQTGSFREAFANHEERFRHEIEKVGRWRDALTEVAGLSGWDSKEWHESKLIGDIIEVIWTKLQPTSFSYPENLVGIYSRLQPVYLDLDLGEDDVRFIGIWGMGGIGKTTMVRVVYERISRQFEFSFLLTNVRDSVEKSDLLNLQKQLLSGIGTKMADILDIYEGATTIRRLLGHRKVLLILDDVNHSSHLEFLAGNQEWFGSGSRILITTRNEHLLIVHRVKRILKVKGFNDEDSFQLFSSKAFERGYPEEDFLELSKSVINYARGLPLALKVLGSFLYGRDLSEWNSALTKLGRVCNSEIFGVLKTSYDGLDDEQKKIFLDISCFFCGEKEDRVTEVLISCYVSAIIEIKVLTERSLLTLSNGRLWMHDLLQEMGREIVRQESPNELGRRSRLWLPEDIKHVLTNNTGTAAIEGIIVDSTESEVKVDVNRKSFSMMNRLRYLKINNGNLPNGLEYLPNSLRILDWTRYPLESLPSHFNPQKLFELSLCHSCIKHFRIGTEPLYKLKTINLSHSLNLVNTPNFKGMPSLEVLILKGCIRLYEVDPTIEVLESLTVLNLEDCKNLVKTPNFKGTPSLKVLILKGCIRLYEVDPTIEVLEKLTVLNLEDCKNLVHFASSVRGLKSLKVLNLSGCTKVSKLPNDMGHSESLEELYLNNTAREVPSFIGLLKTLKELSFAGWKAQSPKSWNMIFNSFLLLLKRSYVPARLSLACLSGLRSLTYLNLSDCNLSEEAIPSDFGCSASLRNLNLSKNQFVRLPESISQLSQLESLSLDQCRKLQTLHVSQLSRLVHLSLNQCCKLQTLRVSQGTQLEYLSLNQCPKLQTLRVSQPSRLQYLSWNKCKLQTLRVSQVSRLEHLSLNQCNLQTLRVNQDSRLEHLSLNQCDLCVSQCELQTLRVSQCELQTLRVSQVPRLEHLSLRQCELQTLCVSQVGRLEHLSLKQCELQTLCVSQVGRLEHLSLKQCELQTLCVSQVPRLEHLSLRQCELQTLCVSQVPRLEHLSLKQCELQTLRVSQCNLQTLRVSRVSRLEHLSLDQCELQTLRVSRVSRLEHLSLDKCELQTLRVSRESRLEHLSLKQCKLQTLRVSRVSGLEHLSLNQCMLQGSLDLNIFP